MKEKKQKEGAFSVILRKIDIFGEPLQWYIGNTKQYGSIIGGFRSFIVVAICLSFLIYSAYILFNERKGSFIYYNIINPDGDNTTITYFDDFEIFFFVQASDYSTLSLDPNIFKLVIEQEFKNVSLDKSISSQDIDLLKESVILSYPFEVCNQTYFINSLNYTDFTGFVGSTYCINETKYRSSAISFNLSANSLLGLNDYPVTFEIKSQCSPNCTNDDYTSVTSKINRITILVKYKLPQPLDMYNPIQTGVETISFTSSYNTTTLYFKTYTVDSDISVFPYVPHQNNTFLSFDYYKDPIESHSSKNKKEWELKFALSANYSYIIRKYDKLENLLANFIGMFNSLRLIGKMITFLFCKFDNEFFVFNSILKSKMKKIFKESRNISSVIPLQTVKKDRRGVAPAYYCLFHKSDEAIVHHFRSENEEIKNVIERRKSHELKFQNIQEKIHNEEDGIQIGRWRQLYLTLLYYLDVYNAKNENITDILTKIRLIHSIFDTSIYVNTVLDVIKLKRVLFDEMQMKLFNRIAYSSEDMASYLKMLSDNENGLSDKELREFLNKMEGAEMTEMTLRLISELNCGRK